MPTKTLLCESGEVPPEVVAWFEDLFEIPHVLAVSFDFGDYIEQEDEADCGPMNSRVMIKLFGERRFEHLCDNCNGGLIRDDCQENSRVLAGEVGEFLLTANLAWAGKRGFVFVSRSQDGHLRFVIDEDT